jgi:hypothetical protein
MYPDPLLAFMAHEVEQDVMNQKLERRRLSDEAVSPAASLSPPRRIIFAVGALLVAAGKRLEETPRETLAQPLADTPAR